MKRPARPDALPGTAGGLGRAGRAIHAGLAAALLAALAAAAPTRPPARPSRAADGARLLVLAAISLREPLEAAGAEFARRTGQAVRASFAGSQQLALQLELGAPADVFASADWRWMDHVHSRGLVESPRPLAGNGLVVVWRQDLEPPLRFPADLARPGLRLVLAAPEVPAGAYARQVLERMAASGQFGPDFVGRVLARVVSEEENVALVTTRVLLGEADAGMVYRTDVPVGRLEGAAGGDRALRVLPVPEPFAVRVDYHVAVSRASARPQAARDFVGFLTGEQGQALLARYGFVPATAAPARGESPGG